MRKIGLILALLLFFAFIFSVVSFTAVATVTEPSIEIYGDLTKDIIDLDNIWLYEDDNGENQTLPYSRSDNLLFETHDIYFKDNFPNKSIAKAAITNEKCTSSWQLLNDANGIPYILGTITNSTGSGVMYSQAVLQTDLTLEDAYLLICGKIHTYEATTTPAVVYYFKFIDEGGEDHILGIRLYNGSGTSEATLTDLVFAGGADHKNDDVLLKHYTGIDLTTQGYALQISINDVFKSAGLSVTIVKFDAFLLEVSGEIDTAKASTTIKAIYRYVVTSTRKIEVNGKPINGTTIEVNDDTITINREVEKIADVQIPFKYSPTPEKSFNDNELSVKYDWEILLPDDSELSFSSVKLNLTIPSGTVESLWINGQDYLDRISSKDPGTEVTLLSSVSAGVQYIVSCKVKYSEEEYYELAQQIKLAWWSPRSWIDKLLAVLLAIVDFFGGIGATYIKRLRTKVRTP